MSHVISCHHMSSVFIKKPYSTSSILFSIMANTSFQARNILSLSPPHSLPLGGGPALAVAEVWISASPWYRARTVAPVSGRVGKHRVARSLPAKFRAPNGWPEARVHSGCSHTEDYEKMLAEAAQVPSAAAHGTKETLCQMVSAK